MPRLPVLASCALAALTPGAVSAQATPAFDPSQVRRLTPEEKERILAESSERNADAALNSALGGGNGGSDNAIHGELGFVAGTGGTVGAYGTTLIPLGDRGAAILSFEDFRTNAYADPNFRRLRPAR